VLVIAYLGAIAAANVVATVWGPAITPFSAFFLVAFDLVARDRLHDRWSGRGRLWRMALLIASGSLVAYLVFPAAGRVALASCVAFAVAGLVDWVIYAWLYPRGWLVRSNGSNLAGAVVDSLLFPWLAFGGLMVWISVGQMLAKVGGGFLWSLILQRR
jgi:queuosine precursor transporter